MSVFDPVICDLRSRYDISEPFYLSDFFKAGGDQRLHEFLTTLHKTVYDKDFRILIVQDCADVYDYHDLPGKSLRALQRHASQIDISNSFILVVTANPNIDQELAQVQRLYSTDACSMQSIIVPDMQYVAVDEPPQDTFCVMPWMHLYVGTDGNVLPCCQADHQFPMGNISEQDIDSIMNSSEFNQLRRDLLQGRRRKECDRCYVQEDAGRISARLNHNQHWPEFSPDVLNPDGTIDQFEPLYLDIRLNNICNLKCRSCSGYFSSAIAQEEVELFGTRNSVDSALRLQARRANLDKIFELVPTVEKIYFAGGEPLLAPEHYEILNQLIACDRTHIEIVYTTNFTTLNFKNQDVLDLWQRFTNVSVGASLDAQYSVAEYVRHGSKWSTIESNLERLQAQCPHVNFTVISTVGALNVSSLIGLQRRWHESKKLDISKFNLNIMLSPEHLTLTMLPQHHKHRLETMIKEHKSWCLSQGAEALANQWQNVIQYMWSAEGSHHLNEFRRLTRVLDTHRKESLPAVLPEYADLI